MVGAGITYENALTRCQAYAAYYARSAFLLKKRGEERYTWTKRPNHQAYKRYDWVLVARCNPNGSIERVPKEQWEVEEVS